MYPKKKNTPDIIRKEGHPKIIVAFPNAPIVCQSEKILCSNKAPNTDKAADPTEKKVVD